MKKGIKNKLGIFISLSFIFIFYFTSEPGLSLYKVGGLSFFIVLLIFFTAIELEDKYLLSIDEIRKRTLEKDIYEIPQSKIRAIITFILGVGFVLTGVALALKPELFVSTFARSATIIQISGIICALFFVAGLIYFCVKIFKKNSSLIINKNGIINNSTANNIGLIEWSDIESIKTVEVLTEKFLMIMTHNPSKYIERAENALTRKTLKSNNKSYGTPLIITSNTLNIKSDDLEQLLHEEFEKYKKRKNK